MACHSRNHVTSGYVVLIKVLYSLKRAQVQREFLSKSFLREEFEHLEKLKTTLQDTAGFENIITVLSNIQIILR